MEDYYEILDIPHNASEEELKSAYRKLARQWHPDVCKQPDAHQQFVKIAKTYEILRDPSMRRQYDYVRAYGQSDHTGQSHSSYSETAQNFNQTQQTARQQDKAYVRKAQAAAVREEMLSLGSRMASGFKGCLLLLMFILTFTGVAAPLAVPIGILIYKSLTHNKRFIGIGNLLGSTILFIIVTALVVMFLFIMSISFS